MGHVESRQITIQGLIIPVDWDDRGNAVAIAVSTFDEDVYLIEEDEMGKCLMSFLREQIEVKGICMLKNSKKAIKITEYSIQKRSVFF